MKRATPKNHTSICVNETYIGETIEQKLFRIKNNKEPIEDGAPLIYEGESDEINKEYNIRTDSFERALDSSDKYNNELLAKRGEYLYPKNDKGDTSESTDGSN